MIKPTYFRPGTLHKDDGIISETPLPESNPGEEWVLVDGTPATCTQLGLYHFFQDRLPVDLVVSGPNYGRNCTSLFSLSSGTIGGAMEGAVFKKRAIALSYAFFNRDHDPDIIAGASNHSVRIIEHLFDNWKDEVDLYSINVPLVEGIGQNKTLYTDVLQNYWRSGSSFEEVDAEEANASANEREHEIRHQTNGSTPEGAPNHTVHKHKYFKWAPKFADVHQSVKESPDGNDGWAVANKMTR